MLHDSKIKVSNFEKVVLFELIQTYKIFNDFIFPNIYNMLGEKVYHSDITTKNESHLIIKPESILSTGVYMIEAKLNGNIIREKLMVN